MNMNLAGRILKGIGAILILLWLYHSFVWRLQPIESLFFPLILFGIGQVLTSRSSSTNAMGKPPVPADFSPSYWHSNIAMDMNAGRLWLRDGARSRVFSKREILTWRVDHDTMQGVPTMVAGGVVHHGTQVKHNSRLAIQTTDMDHPTYQVRFKSRGFWFGSEGNHQDATTWASRLNAFMNSENARAS